MSQLDAHALLELIQFVSDNAVNAAFPLLMKNNDLDLLLKQMSKYSDEEKVYASLFIAAILLHCTMAQ